MTPSFDPKPLNAFFQEVEDQLRVKLEYVPDNTEYPIQVKDAPDGISRDKAHEVSQFIKAQVDLRDNEICKIHPVKKGPKVAIEITKTAAKALAEVYALSLFYDPDEEEGS